MDSIPYPVCNHHHTVEGAEEMGKLLRGEAEIWKNRYSLTGIK